VRRRGRHRREEARRVYPPEDAQARHRREDREEGDRQGGESRGEEERGEEGRGEEGRGREEGRRGRQGDEGRRAILHPLHAPTLHRLLAPGAPPRRRLLLALRRLWRRMRVPLRWCQLHALRAQRLPGHGVLALLTPE
jgi:hypothetical protein